MVQQVNAEMVGGIPLVTVIGTPRAMGEHLGDRLAPRLQVLSQYLSEQLISMVQGNGGTLDADRLRADLRTAITPAARIDPQTWMEIESMARACGLPPEDLLLVHGYTDLLSHYGATALPGASTFVALPGSRCDQGRPRVALAWHLDPSLLPYVTLVRRVPAHGPASLALTLAGLHPVAGLSEAGVACASNELIVRDSGGDLFTTHLVSATLTAPTYDDALERCQAAPRRGGRAIHLMATDGRRTSLELSGRRTARLTDAREDAPRVHTNHALDHQIKEMVAAEDPCTRPRLSNVAARAVATPRASLAGIAALLGLGGSPEDKAAARDLGAAPDTTVVLIAEPGSKQVHIRRGGAAPTLEMVGL